MSSMIKKSSKNKNKSWNCKTVNLTNSKINFLSDRRHTFIPKWQHLLSWTSILYAICWAVWRPENLEGKRSNRRPFNRKGFTSISFKVCYWFVLLHIFCKYSLIFWICKGTSAILNLRTLKMFFRCWIRETIWRADIFWHFWATLNINTYLSTYLVIWFLVLDVRYFEAFLHLPCNLTWNVDVFENC